MRVILLLVLVVFLCGCFGVRTPETPGFPAPGDGDSPGQLLNSITYWAVGLATLGLFASIAIAIFTPRIALARRLATFCVAVIIAGPVLLWVGANLWWISLVTALLGGAAYIWVHRKYLEKYVGKDLDGDGVIHDLQKPDIPDKPSAADDEYAPHTEEGAK